MKRSVFVAALTTLALATSGAGTAAAASTLVSGVTEGLDPGLAVCEGSGQLSVVKPVVEGFDPARPLVSGTSGVPGASLTLSRVEGFSVFDAGDWDRVRGLDLKDMSGVSLSDVATLITDDRGVVEFSGLDSGFYLLRETGSVAVGGYRVIDTLVSVPVGEDGSWQCSVSMVAKQEKVREPVVAPSPSPVVPAPSTTPPETTPPTVTTRPPMTPSTSTPPSTTEKIPLYPGGPKVVTGGVAIPSLTGEGNMSLFTMMALLALILAAGYGVVHGVASRIVASRLISRDED